MFSPIGKHRRLAKDLSMQEVEATKCFSGGAVGSVNVPRFRRPPSVPRLHLEVLHLQEPQPGACTEWPCFLQHLQDWWMDVAVIRGQLTNFVATCTSAQGVGVGAGECFRE